MITASSSFFAKDFASSFCKKVLSFFSSESSFILALSCKILNCLSCASANLIAADAARSAASAARSADFSSCSDVFSSLKQTILIKITKFVLKPI